MLGRIALVISSMLLTLLILELGARLMHGPEGVWKWQNLVLLERDPMAGTRQGRFVYDAQLGFISTPNFKSTDVNYDARGYRMGPLLAGRRSEQAARRGFGRFLHPWRRGDRHRNLACTTAGHPALAGRQLPVSQPMASTRRFCAPSGPWPS